MTTTSEVTILYILTSPIDRIYVYDAQNKNFNFNQNGKIGKFVDYRCFRINPPPSESIDKHAEESSKLK